MRALVAAVVLSAVCPARATSTLTWNTNTARVTADVQAVPLPRLLEGIAKLTGWQVYLEENATRNVSAKFRDLQSGDALRMLLGDLNFAVLPQTNGPSRLYVFRTSQQNATQLMRPADLNAGQARQAKAIPNELVVRVKPGVNIDELARKIGAKVIGRIDGLNAYRLQFNDAAGADAARSTLADNPDIASVESNFVVDPPPSALPLNGNPAPPIQLKLNPPDSSGRVIVGLVDTSVQSLGNNLDSFLLKSLSVAGQSTADPNLPTHGTSMFEDILRGAAAASGGSSSLQVINVDVYGPNQTTSTFDVASGITQAVNNGANIINLSLGGTGDSPLLSDLVSQVIQKGIPIFAAAGNDASGEPYYPAAYPGVISVTASSNGKLASYANYGSFIDLIAPGSAIVNFGNTAYVVTGTSTSTALMSGTTGGMAASKNVSPNTAASGLLNTPSFQYKGH